MHYAILRQLSFLQGRREIREAYLNPKKTSKYSAPIILPCPATAKIRLSPAQRQKLLVGLQDEYHLLELSALSKTMSS